MQRSSADRPALRIQGSQNYGLLPSLLSVVAHDARRIVRAIPVMWNDVREQERIDCSISLFSAASFVAVPSLTTEYFLVLANDTSQPLLRKILIDIYKCNRPVHPEGHYAWFDRSFRLPPGKSCEIKLTYDWLGHARFILDGVALSPDGFWRGDCNAVGRYAVHAVLFDAGGNRSEELFIVQDLKP
jgi:hypothetical protein